MPRRKKKPVTQAIVLAKRERAIQQQSALPQIEQAVQSMERVRRFVSRCLNVDLQRALLKLEAQKNLTADDRTKREKALRQKLEIDWGTIPGVDKPFLMQPGAEKFLFWLNLRPKFFKKEVELLGGHLEMIASVIVYSKKTGEEVFEGPDCSCSTMESNFRYRWLEVEVAPPDDVQDRMKAQGMGRWRKKDKWAHGKLVQKDKWTWFERIENANISDERNKVRQIGEKRALVKCVKNMGAISEIFTADPSEWEIPEEGGSPADDEDFTPGGRRIFTQDGVSPSGRYEDPSMRPRDTRERGPKVAPTPQPAAQPAAAPNPQAEAPKPTPKPRRKITVTWPAVKDGCVYLTGTGDLGSILPAIKEKTLCVYLARKLKYAVPETEAHVIAEIAAAYDYEYEEIQEPPSSGSPTPAAAPKTAAAQPDAPATVGAGTKQPPSIVPAAGVIIDTRTRSTAKKMPYMNVNLAGVWHQCYHRGLFEYLPQGKGKECELLLNERKQIIGIRKIGTRMFEDDGKTPIIALDEARGGNLFA